MAHKPILCLDFDGVIHKYSKGWQGGAIYDTYVPGFFKWASEACKHFKLVVYSSRSKDPDGSRLMREAIGKWSIQSIIDGEMAPEYDWSELFGALEYAHEKPPAFLTIDDRAITFNGVWSHPWLAPSSLLTFKPWNVD